MHVASSDVVFSSQSNIRIEWSPESILPIETTDNYQVDISLYSLDTKTGERPNLVSLGTELAT